VRLEEKDGREEKLRIWHFRSHLWNYNIWQRECWLHGQMLDLDHDWRWDPVWEELCKHCKFLAPGRGHQAPVGVGQAKGYLCKPRGAVGREPISPSMCLTWDHPLIIFGDLRSVRARYCVQGWHSLASTLFFHIFRVCPLHFTLPYLWFSYHHVCLLGIGFLCFYLGQGHEQDTVEYLFLFKMCH
jgi:hypothetical protein